MSQTALKAEVPAYEYTGGPGLSNADAQLLIALAETIERECGRLKSSELADEIIKRSRLARSATHHLFEWDQAKGHAIYLLERARRLVTMIRVVFVDAPDSPVQAMPVVTFRGKRGPLPMPRVLNDADMTAAVVEQALADLETWKRRYERLMKVAKLRPVFRVIGRATRKTRAIERKGK